MNNLDTVLICPVCSSYLHKNECNKIKYPLENPDLNNFTKPHSILFCKNCNLGIAQPLLSDSAIESLYSENVYWQSSKVEVISSHKFPGHYALAYSRWNFLKQFITNKNPSVLDIGSGHGFIGMIAAKDKSIQLKDYCVVEKDNFLRESLKKTWNMNFPDKMLSINQSLFGIERKFDIVILSNILEHLRDPKEMLSAAKQKINRGGFIFIDTPNEDYYFKKDVFPHLCFFSQGSLKMLIEKTGLKLNHLAGYGRDRESPSINYRNEKKILKNSERLIYKFRFFIPEVILRLFFNWYFGAEIKSDKGAWVRAIAKNNYV